jgi:hypothetical protein
MDHFSFGSFESFSNSVRFLTLTSAFAKASAEKSGYKDEKKPRSKIERRLLP